MIRDEQELRRLVGPSIDHVETKALSKFLRKCPDLDLAATALTMIPRPKWVEEIVGPMSDKVAPKNYPAQAPD